MLRQSCRVNHVASTMLPQPSGNSDLELRVTATASVPGESNHDVTQHDVQPRGLAPRFGKGAFPRSARLLRHADFERVYKLGRRHFSASMTVFYWPRPEATTVEAQAGAKSPAAAGLRIGFTVSRALGGAVERNRMKRRLREAVRLTRPPTGPSADVVINPKKSLLTADFAAVVNEVSRAFVVIEERLEDKAAASTGKKDSRRRKPKAESRKPKA
jgi:ribonuclease P protein component